MRNPILIASQNLDSYPLHNYTNDCSTLRLNVLSTMLLFHMQIVSLQKQGLLFFGINISSLDFPFFFKQSCFHFNKAIVGPICQCGDYIASILIPKTFKQHNYHSILINIDFDASQTRLENFLRNVNVRIRLPPFVMVE